ncbi:MAG: DUF4465 domain-containing protein [Pirellulaceae bacterium]|nr:DUF4465 domain-containing protein [Pirellulaceae bacterium]
MQRMCPMIVIRAGVTIGFLVSWSLGGIASTRAGVIINFDELSTWTETGPTGSYFNGNRSNATNSDGWTAGTGPVAYFGNTYTHAFGGYWNGCAYSNVNNTVSGGYTNQYAAVTGTGFGGSGNYALVFDGSQAYFDMPMGWRADSVRLTNTTYAWDSMKNGDAFSKKFGGVSGNDADWFMVSLTGYSGFGGNGANLGTVDFYLADFRFADNSLDYIVDQWTEVHLAGLGDAASVKFSFSGSDMGAFGLNTPAYVALDHLRLTAVPEPSGGGLLVMAVVAMSRRTRRRRVEPMVDPKISC